MRSRRSGAFSEYRWRRLPVCLCAKDTSLVLAMRCPGMSSPSLDPGYVAAKALAEIDCGPMQWQLRGGCPKLELVAVAMTTMAEVAADHHVHRERATPTPRCGLVQWTTSVPLRPRSIRGLEPKQAQDLLHRDFAANSVEVDSWHGCSSLRDETPRCVTTVPFPLSL
jgi:hypothetical protein